MRQRVFAYGLNPTNLLPIQSAERRKTIGTPDNSNAGMSLARLIPHPFV